MTILEEITRSKRAELDGLKRRVPLESVMRQAQSAQPTRSLAQALSGSRLKVIAEVKQASPSRGLLTGSFDATGLAKAYAGAGASAISVITEKNYFMGNARYLPEIRRELGTDCPPLLRKDFIFDQYQVYETRAMAGDALLLIAALLTSGELENLIGLSHSLGLDCLVEVHDEREIATVLRAGAVIIGINNRDLNTFRVDIETTVRLRPLIPESCLAVSESGFKTRFDVERIKGLGINAVLVGEALVAAADIAGCMEELIG